jgi:hypothetical protein
MEIEKILHKRLNIVIYQKLLENLFETTLSRVFDKSKKRVGSSKN